MRGILLCGVACVALLGCSDLPTEPAPLPAAPEAAPAAALTSAVPPYEGCEDDEFGTGALYRICFPENWNGDVVLWAHGYESIFDDLAIPDDLVDGVPIEDIVQSLRFAYATTSYRDNGLVAVAAVEDLTQLATAVRMAAPNTRFVYLVGASEGGLSSALALERVPQFFDGGLIACAPTGSFRGQINYFGDVRVVFDALFPGVIDGSPVNIPGPVIDNWDGLQTTIAGLLASQPGRTAQLIKVAGIAVDPANPTSAGQSILAALWYNIFATNDAVTKLGGNPFDNRFRWYSGSSNDFLLNLRVQRIRGDAGAIAALGAFEANGRLRRPAQGIHTRYDPVIPFWQAQVYALEALFGSGLQLLSVPSANYGHCAFDVEEVLASFAVLVLRVTGANLLASAAAFPDDASIARFQRLAAEAGARPEVWTPSRIAAELARH